MAHATQSRFVEGPAGRLDARFDGPEDGQPVLLLHPHPQWGGTMGSRLVHDVAQGLAEAGFRVVRFNFRGVGRSEGAYASGPGEVDDAAAVFDAMAAETGKVPIVVGYSFGGAVACRLATLRKPLRLVLIGTPLALSESKLRPVDDAPRVAARTDIVVGDRDGFVPLADAQTLAAAFSRPAHVAVIEGAGHFLEPSHNEQAVAAVATILAGLE
ncbi:MAG: alpha/beta fold hydrolase [bacterium]